MDELNTLNSLFQAIESSNSHPLLIFKHSLTCPISARAFKEVKNFIETESPDVRTVMVVVQQSRDVSNEAAAILKVEHESPQVILVKDGKSVWNTSHFQITSENLKISIESIRK
jgi:bacillithiol system protein YtxJ